MVMSRIRTLAAALPLAALVLSPAGARAADAGSWNRPDQKAVVRAGVMANQPGGFEGQRPLAAQDLSTALAAIAVREGVQPVSAPSGTPSVATFDRLLVNQLGLADLAASVQAEARRAGLS